MATATTTHHRGEMDIHEQVATFHAVMAMTKWGSLTVAVSLLFAILLFCTGTGFGAALAAAVIVAAVGVAALKQKKAPAR